MRESLDTLKNPQQRSDRYVCFNCCILSFGVWYCHHYITFSIEG